MSSTRENTQHTILRGAICAALLSGGTLLASNALDSTQAVTSGNTWGLPATDITLPDPA